MNQNYNKTIFLDGESILLLPLFTNTWYVSYHKYETTTSFYSQILYPNMSNVGMDQMYTVLGMKEFHTVIILKVSVYQTFSIVLSLSLPCQYFGISYRTSIYRTIQYINLRYTIRLYYIVKFHITLYISVFLFGVLSHL